MIQEGHPAPARILFASTSFSYCQAMAMAPPRVFDNYSKCERPECQTRASKLFHRHLDNSGETLWYCSAEHKQKDRKRCERRNKNLRTKVHQQAAAAQAIEAVGSMNSTSTAPGQRLLPSAAVCNDIANVSASKCYLSHNQGVSEQERR